MFQPQQSRPNVTLARAQPSDFQAIHTLWMQPHALPFLGFEDTSLEAFRPIFDSTMATSDVYVLKENNQVIAVRRVIQGTGRHAHTVEFGSFAVDKAHLNKGVATLFYNLLIDEVKARPGIKRIEAGITTDNEAAFKLSQKMGFKPTVIFAERPRRKTGPETYTKKWHVGSLYVEFLLEPIDTSLTIQIEPFVPQLPLLSGDTRTECTGFTIASTQWVRRFEHIQVWEINYTPSSSLNHAHAFLRHQLCEASTRCKKIELYVYDQPTMELVKNLGAYARGKKTASCIVDNRYYDEVAVEFSFFNIQDATEIVSIYKQQPYERSPLLSALAQCQSVITAASNNHEIDEYGKLYLENLVFQMTREAVGEKAIRRYGEANQEPQPWPALIAQLTPHPAIQHALITFQHTFFPTQPIAPSIEKTALAPSRK